MPFEVTPPKYARVVGALQARIEDGTYPPGSMLPSENQLSAEFDMSRPTVVRALSILRQDGWIESHQGKGHFVRGRPAVDGRRPPAHVSAAIDVDESVGVELLNVGPLLATPRVAQALAIDEGTPVIARRWLTTTDDGPVELASAYFRVEATAGTDLAKPEPIKGGVRRHMETRTQARFDYVNERVAARLADADEAERLGIATKDPVLTLLVTVHDPAGQPLLALDIVLPADRHELEDSYALS